MSNKLGDYIEFKNGLNYDKTHKGNGCKIVGVANFKNNLHINFENLDEVKSDIVSDDMLLKNDDLLFVRSNGNKSLVGRCLFVSDLQEKMSFSGFTIRARIKNKQKLLPKYFLYYATAPNFKNSLYKKIGGGTNIRNLTQAVLEDINIELPELDNQKKIANCLDQITQKIQLNNKINDELEKLAKTLYEYWFVQFDFPDENNRPYKSSGGEMVYSNELKREIPLDWEIGNLYTIADYYNGLACQKFRPIDNEQSLPVVKIGEMHNGINVDTELVKANIPAKNIIDSGDILFSWSATLEVMLWTGNKAGLNQHIFKVVPKSFYSKEYVYQQLSSYVINFVRIAEARKTTMGHITTDHLKQSKITLPPKEIIEKYSHSTEFVYKKMIECKKENLYLIKLRDFLLPMLMNGQVIIQQ